MSSELGLFHLPSRLTFTEAKICSAQLKRDLQKVTEEKLGESVVLDAALIEDFDSSALAVLIQFRRDAIELKYKGVVIKNMPSKLRELTRLYGIDALLPDVQNENC